MPGKYQPLADWLAAQPRADVLLTFTQIEQILGAALPPSARASTSWWMDSRPSRAQAQPRLAAGWQVAAVDRRRAVVLYRGESPG